MHRRSSAVLAALLLLTSAAALGQPKRQLCFLSFDQMNKDRAIHFFESLRKLGYVDGRNITVHALLANGDGLKFPDLARECVRRRAFLLAVANKAAKAMDVTIPKSVLVRATTIID